MVYNIIVQKEYARIFLSNIFKLRVIQKIISDLTIVQKERINIPESVLAIAHNSMQDRAYCFKLSEMCSNTFMTPYMSPNRNSALSIQ